jgi:DNA polymerase-1
MKELRPIVLPDSDENGIIEVDYCGAEIGTVAAKYRDPTAKALYDTGKAVAAMAQMLFPDLLSSVPLGEIKPHYENQYDIAKIASYGSLYGMTAKTLAATLGLTLTEAEEIAHRLATNVWPLVEHGLQAEIAQAARSRRSTITPGLFRHLTGITASNSYRLRTIPRNTPIQGLCAAVFRRACIYADLAITPFGGRLLLPIHDALLATAPLHCLAEAAAAVKNAMERAALDELGDFVQLQAEIAMKNPTAWSKKGSVDSFDLFLADPTFRL